MVGFHIPTVYDGNIISSFPEFTMLKIFFFQFKDKTTGTNVPKNFIPAIKKAFEESCLKGHLSGHKVVGVRFVLQVITFCPSGNYLMQNYMWLKFSTTPHILESQKIGVQKFVCQDFPTMHMTPCCSSKETFLIKNQCHQRKICMLSSLSLTNSPSFASTNVL